MGQEEKILIIYFPCFFVLNKKACSGPEALYS